MATAGGWSRPCVSLTNERDHLDEAMAGVLRCGRCSCSSLLVATILIGVRPPGSGIGSAVRQGLAALYEVGERLFVAVVGTQLTLVLLARLQRRPAQSA